MTLLQAAAVSVDVEAVLNRLTLPAKDATTGAHDALFLQQRRPLQTALEKANTDILLAQGAAQRVRRRLARLLHSLLTDEAARPTKATKLAALEPKAPLPVTAGAITALHAALSTVNTASASAAAGAGAGASSGEAGAVDAALATLQEALTACLPCALGAEETKAAVFLRFYGRH